MSEEFINNQKLYSELADWWQIFSPTSDYADEAKFFISLFENANAKTILELGSGVGNIAWYMKAKSTMTLTDLSDAMLEESKKQNPECDHIAGDMRKIRLGRTFDGVFIHDAIMYMLTKEDLVAALRTASEHLKPNGVLVVAPDCTKETFKETIEYESRDASPPDDRAVRYMQWITDPDPNDTIFNYDFVIALKQGDSVKTILDRQVCGVFPRTVWLDAFRKAGFEAEIIKDTSTAGAGNERAEIFVGYKR